MSITEEEECDSDFGDAFLGGGNGRQRATNSTTSAVALVAAATSKCSTSFVQRHLQIGYNRAARLIEQMEEENIIGPANHVGKREIFARQPDEDR